MASHFSANQVGRRGAGRLILSLCDRTGIWSAPYAEAGYEVVRVDIVDGLDVRLMRRPELPVHGILAAPPCTHFSKAGAWKWAEKGDTALLEGLSIVDACLRLIVACRPAWWALENPIGRLKDFIGDPAWRCDPCDFGDPWTKRTLLWGHFTPPVPLVSAQARQAIPREALLVGGRPGGRDRTTRLSSRDPERLATPPGFARAFFEANP